MQPSNEHQRIVQKFGWIPDLPDRRDHFYSAPSRILRALPPKIDLIAQCPTIYDQGEVGSCTAQAIASAIQFERKKHNQQPDFIPSRLFIYYNEREIERTVMSDSGAMLRDGIKTAKRQGVCPEDMWSYDPRPFPPDGDNQKGIQKPSQACYTEALKHQLIAYHRLIQNNYQMKGCLADGYPFIFGFSVFQSIFDETVSKSGNIPLPSDGEAPIGGHAVLAVGYDDELRCFIIRNSWGDSWGKKGYGTIPYSYLNDPSLADDFWTIRMMEA